MQPSMLDSQVTFECVFRTEPMEWQAPQFNRKTGAVYSSKEYKAYKEALGMALRAAWQRSAEPGEFWVRFTFHCGSTGRKRPRDWDNLSKAVGDAGNKIIWKDDSQITQCRGVIVVRGSLEPRTEIEGGLR